MTDIDSPHNKRHVECWQCRYRYDGSESLVWVDWGTSAEVEETVVDELEKEWKRQMKILEVDVF